MSALIWSLRATRLLFALWAASLLILVVSNVYHPLVLCIQAEYVGAKVLPGIDPTQVAVALLVLMLLAGTAVLSTFIHGVRRLAARKPVSE